MNAIVLSGLLATDAGSGSPSNIVVIAIGLIAGLFIAYSVGFTTVNLTRRYGTSTDATSEKAVGSDSVATVSTGHSFESTVGEAFFRSSPDCIFVLDDAGEILRRNAAAKAAFGSGDANDASGTIKDLLFSGGPRASETSDWKTLLGVDETSPNQDPIELEAISTDGETLPLEVTTVPTATAEGTRYAVFARNISARRHTMKELEELNSRLIETSRQAGMAEVATGVLHNVGNVLNSVNVSAGIIMDRLGKSRVELLRKAADVVNEKRHNLSEFFCADERGKHFPRLFDELASNLIAERESQREEVRELIKNVEHLKSIVGMQQSYAHTGGTVAPVDIVSLVDDALKINDAGFTRHGVKVERIFDPVSDIVTDKHKVLQVLVNLISNAKKATSDCAKVNKLITVEIHEKDGEITVKVADNGVGIPAENLQKIFSHGFTTRETGHGFGLHSCALTMQQLGGSLSVHSDGPNQGATFTMRVPAKREAPSQSAD